MTIHIIERIEEVPQACEPFDPPHWFAACSCGRFNITFGEELARQWAADHGDVSIPG